MSDTAGPVIVWENYGTEGWQPKSYSDLKAALTAQRFNSEFVVTHRAHFRVIDLTSRPDLLIPSIAFECAYCRERDVLVSGPHSHACSRCGDQAIGGWYTVPWCQKCKDVVLAQ